MSSLFSYGFPIVFMLGMYGLVIGGIRENGRSATSEEKEEES